MPCFLKSLRILGTILLLALGTLVPISTASAHTELINTSPVADTLVNAAPESISLTFSEPPLVDGAAIVVVNSTGDTLNSPAPTLDGASLSILWPADLTPGQTIVRWRATAQDGHVESGEFIFNYTAAAEGGMAASPIAVPSESADPMMTALATPEAIGMPLAIADASADNGNNNLVLGIAIVSLVGLVAAGLFLRRSK